MWKPPELSGWLEQQGISNPFSYVARDYLQEPFRRRKWRQRYFVLKGSYLFYFHHPTSSTPEGMIPMEYAFLETSEESKDLDKLRYVIKIKMHKAYESYCPVTSFKVASGKQDIRNAWFSALSHVVLPLRVLIRELKDSGRLQQLMDEKYNVDDVYKNKVSFFMPGRFIQEDSEYSESNHEEIEDGEDDHLTPRKSIPYSRRTVHFTHQERDEPVEDLQTMMGRASTQHPSILKQNPTSDFQIKSVYDTILESEAQRDGRRTGESEQAGSSVRMVGDRGQRDDVESAGVGGLDEDTQGYAFEFPGSPSQREVHSIRPSVAFASHRPDRRTVYSFMPHNGERVQVSRMKQPASRPRPSKFLPYVPENLRRKSPLYQTSSIPAGQNVYHNQIFEENVGDDLIVVSRQ